MGKARITTVVAAIALAGGLASAPLLAGASPAPSSSSTTSTTAAPPAATRALDDDVHLNQIQVTGSHNSYHILPPQKEVELRHSFLGDADQGLEYRHAPLPQQFQSQKVRQIELDLFLDHAGGKYADPLLRSVAGDGPYDPVMSQPGIKVLHVQDVDYASTCLTFKACLTQVKQWSDANPTHAPIAILLELKDDDVPFPGFTFVHPDPFDAAAMDTVDDEIRSVMPASDLITPDDVRGSHLTLQEAVTTDGWPTLGDSRGKVMFLMDNAGAKRTAYLAGHPNLEGRAIFTNAPAGAPDAAFVEHNEASDVSVIQDLVQQGYVVRTRADGDTSEARANDTSDRDDAYASGAQWVSTDYPVPNWAIGFTSPYFSEVPGGTVARCNPVNAPASCVSSEIDDIYDPVAPPPPSTTTTTAPPSTTVPGQDVDPAAGAQPVSGTADYTG
ncbi:phosphatidylinositol-specific phospholipase C1-like protein [Aquihabitans sp. G128]|uniref:phosphatidylinositol-specific phospholipase C1-like protein n=1 Tax=Aquihabitans sp. G128 TaxID=2849779 RepID=UPI001C216B8A|nr:phosphatidylinositol-specific phospholipase C1-like protein [Aquihabitans sp. G128]QXC62671.1 phosphatidylinositol-specific phospholipase C1-like protein [Aquihabitans sp. G128]